MTIEELKRYKRILLVGYGVEGKATEQFLKKHVPNSKIGITDQKDGANYLAKQKNFDLAIRSPGVAKELITIP